MRTSAFRILLLQAQCRYRFLLVLFVAYGFMSDPVLMAQDACNLKIKRLGNAVTISWDAGVLETASELRGPWQIHTGQSPVAIDVMGQTQFYRTRVSQGDSVTIHAVESSIVLEGCASGTSLECGWPVALFGSGFSADMKITSSEPNLSIGPITVAQDGSIAAFAVAVDPIPTLLRGQTHTATLTVSSRGATAHFSVDIIGLSELDLRSGDLLPSTGLYSRLELPVGVTVTSTNQRELEEVPNLLITGPISLRGAIDLQGRGYAGGLGGKGGSGGTRGTGGNRGFAGFSGYMGKTGGGPFGAFGGDGGTGGTGSSSYQGWSGEQGAPGEDAVQADSWVIGEPGVIVAQLPGSGGGGGGGQGGQGGGTGSYGQDGVPGHPGGNGGGALRLRGLGRWTIDGGRIDLQGIHGELSNDRGGSGGNGNDGGLWLAGSWLRAAGAMDIITSGTVRLDAPSDHGVDLGTLPCHGPVLDRPSLPAVVNAEDMTVNGWVMGGNHVRVVVTDLVSGHVRHFNSAALVGSKGSVYLPFNLNIQLFPGFNRIELLAGAPGHWISSADSGLIRVFSLQGAKVGFLQQSEELLGEFEAKLGVIPAVGTNPTLSFPVRIALEVEPNDTSSNAFDLGSLGNEERLILEGSIGVSNESDYFAVRLPEGVVAVAVESQPASQLYLKTRLVDEADSSQVQFVYMDWTRSGSCLRTFELPHDSGPSRMAILQVYGRTEGPYTLTVTTEYPGKAYLPHLVLAPRDRVIGSWWQAGVADSPFEFVTLDFNADGSASLYFKRKNESTEWLYRGGTFEVMSDFATWPHGDFLWFFQPSEVISYTSTFPNGFLAEWTVPVLGSVSTSIDYTWVKGVWLQRDWD